MPRLPTLRGSSPRKPADSLQKVLGLAPTGHPTLQRRLPGYCRDYSSSRFRVRHSGLPLRFWLASVRFGQRRLGSALSATSGDSSPQRDHSPGSLPVAGSGRDTGSFAALPPAPTPSSTHGRRLHSAPATCAPTALARYRRPAQAPLGWQGSLDLRLTPKASASGMGQRSGETWSVFSNLGGSIVGSISGVIAST